MRSSRLFIKAATVAVLLAMALSAIAPAFADDGWPPEITKSTTTITITVPPPPPTK